MILDGGPHLIDLAAEAKVFQLLIHYHSVFVRVHRNRICLVGGHIELERCLRARRLASAVPCKRLQLGCLKRIGLCNPVNGYNDSKTLVVAIWNYFLSSGYLIFQNKISPFYLLPCNLKK